MPTDDTETGEVPAPPGTAALGTTDDFLSQHFDFTHAPAPNIMPTNIRSQEGQAGTSAESNTARVEYLYEGVFTGSRLVRDSGNALCARVLVVQRQTRDTMRRRVHQQRSRR